MEQRSVIRSESFYHNILPQLIFPLERQEYALGVVESENNTNVWKESEREQWKILLLLKPHRRC